MLRRKKYFAKDLLAQIDQKFNTITAVLNFTNASISADYSYFILNLSKNINHNFLLRFELWKDFW